MRSGRCVFGRGSWVTFVKMIEVRVDGFAAMVTPFKDLPATTIFPVFREPDTFQQFMKSVDILRDQVAVELLPDFDALPLTDISELVTQWMGETNEAG